MAEVSKIFLSDKTALKKVDALLAKDGIRRDPNLDYICGIYDGDLNLIATGSAFSNTLRCFAVDTNHQGEGLLNTIMTHLLEVQHERGNFDLYLYTKDKTARFFHDLGFYEIASVDHVVFMENQRNGFSNCLKRFHEETDIFLRQHHDIKKRLADSNKGIGAIVMNANPFTLGHRYLVQKAAKNCTLLHIFLLSEDASLFPFTVRKKLVVSGIAGISNVILHESGPYIISHETFPSYFQKNEEAVSRSHARLDIAVFKKIAESLGITCRFVGNEPFSEVTNLYNDVMYNELPAAGIKLEVIPRLEKDGQPVSASTVRQLIKGGIRTGRIDWDRLSVFLPVTTLLFLKSDGAKPALSQIAAADEVRHH